MILITGGTSQVGTELCLYCSKLSWTNVNKVGTKINVIV